MASDSDNYGAPPNDVVMAQHGIVCSAHPYATSAGINVMRRGGNAVDAAIAAAAVLTMVEPRNGHLGGDTFVQISLPDAQGVVAINGSGRAPENATLDRFGQTKTIPEDGLLSAAVPGTVDCWGQVAARYGTMKLAELLEPAAAYAQEGVPVTNRLHQMIALDADKYSRSPESAKTFLPNGEVPRVGTIWQQPELAKSLRLIGADGEKAFYDGELTEKMVAYSSSHGGLFTHHDFASHKTETLEPLSTTYRGYVVFEQPPVSQGLIVLIALNILQEFDLQATGQGSAETLHLLIEATKLAFEARIGHLGDPAFVVVPIEQLLSSEYAKEQAARIDLKRAAARPVPVSKHRDTTYLCTADQSGLMVSYIHSLFSGSGVVMGETGILMNSRMLGFELDPRHPNCLAPGKRPVHTLNTYVVYQDNHPVLVGGTPGAHWQVQTNLQILTNVLDFNMDPQSAIDAPRFTLGDQLTLGDQTLKLELRFHSKVIEQLVGLGHCVDITGPWDSGGSVQLIARDTNTGIYSGATEVRRPGSSVIGY